jgi:hypothetical protein
MGNFKNRPDLPHPLLNRYFIGLTLVLFIAIQVHFIDFLPLWDGRWYLEVIHILLNRPFDLLAFSLGHSAIAYGLMVAFTQWIGGGGVVYFHILQIVIGCVGIFSFHKILRFIFKDKFSIEVSFLTLIYAIHPMVMAGSLGPTLDFPVTSFALAMVASLLYEKVALFFVFSILAIFTRETGLSIYVAFCLAYLVGFILRKKISISKVPQKIVVLVAPLVAFLLFAVFKRMSGAEIFWGGASSSPQNLISLFLKFDLTNPFTVTHLLQIFVLDFNWIFTLAILLFLGGILLSKLISFVLNRPFPAPHKPLDIDRTAFYSLFFVFLVNGILLVNYQTYVIPRYRIPLIPLFLIFGLYCFLALFQQWPKIRIWLLALFSLLFFAQNFYSLDLVSNNIFGTFDFGSHTLLCMNRIISRQPDCGRDQIAYNLQYTQVSRLANEAAKFLVPGLDGNVHILSTVTNNIALVIPNIDTRTGTLTLGEGNGILKPIFYSSDYRHVSDATVPVKLLEEVPESALPSQMYFLTFPMYDDGHFVGLRLQRKGYRLAQFIPIQKDGYELDLYQYIR